MAQTLKTFVDGNSLPASDLNTYLMNQVTVVCTSGDRPSSPPEGMFIYETDTNRTYVNSIGWRQVAGPLNWITPTINSGDGWGAVAGFPTPGYARFNQHIHLRGVVTGGAATTSIFTIASNYRPATRTTFGVAVNGTYDSNGATIVTHGGRLTINTSGTVVLDLPVFNPANVVLNGLYFEVDE